jgi:tetratricopeptide (TPR) repeat protein
MTDEKPYMVSRSRRKWQLWLLLTTLFPFAIGISAETLNPVRVMFTYDHLLKVAEEKIITDSPNQAFSFLAKAKEIMPEPEFRYYNLTGEAFWKLGNHYEAMSAFEKSVELNPSQFSLLLRIADFYESERKPDVALIYNEKFLKIVPTEKLRIFKVAILSRRIGNETNYQKYIQILESDKSFASEQESLQASLSRNLKLRKWKEAEELTLRYLPYFPRVEGMYETLILARRGKKSPLIEDAYTMACVTFKDETRYYVRFGVFLQENGRYLESLSMFRRALFNALKFNVKSDWGELLFLLRQSYGNLGWELETLAIDSLVQDIKNKDKLTDEQVENHIQSYRKNREYLLFGLYWFKDKNPEKASIYKSMLNERDQASSEKEFLFVIGPFALEKLDF